MPQEHPDTREQAREAKQDYTHWTDEVDRLKREIDRLQLDLDDARARRDIAGRAQQRLGYGPEARPGGRR